jgi:hypothetical protein
VNAVSNKTRGPGRKGRLSEVDILKRNMGREGSGALCGVSPLRPTFTMMIEALNEMTHSEGVRTTEEFIDGGYVSRRPRIWLISGMVMEKHIKKVSETQEAVGREEVIHLLPLGAFRSAQTGCRDRG